MKIYRKIVFDYNFNVIEEDSYEYDGEIDKCEGGGTGDTDTDTSVADAANNAAASAQGEADAQANAQTSFGSTGHFGPTAEASYDNETRSRNYATDTGWGYNMNAPSLDKGQFAKDTLRYGLPATAVTQNPAIGMTLGAAKAAYNQSGAFSNLFASSPPSSYGKTGLGMGAETDKSSGAETPSNYVWNGSSFVSPASVSPTSATGGTSMAQGIDAAGQAYLQKYPDIAADPYYSLHPNEHFATFGQAEGRTWTGTSSLNLEDQLKTEQLGILRQQRSESDALNKLVYQAAGIIKDPTTGEWRKATDAEKRSLMTDTESKEYDLYLQQLDRHKMALEGRLPVSPALERELSDWDAENKESLTRRLGTNYMTSTPGIQSQARQEERTGLLREEARRGEIAAGSSRVLDWRNSLNNQNAQTLNAYGAIPGRTSGLLTGYAGALVPYTQQASINAANDRQTQALAQDARQQSQILEQNAYWNRQTLDTQQKKDKWSMIGTLGGYLFS